MPCDRCGMERDVFEMSADVSFSRGEAAICGPCLVADEGYWQAFWDQTLPEHLWPEGESTTDPEDVKRLCCGRLRKAVTDGAVPLGLYSMGRGSLRVSLIAGQGRKHPHESMQIYRCIFCGAILDQSRLGATDLPGPPEERPEAEKAEVPEAD